MNINNMTKAQLYDEVMRQRLLISEIRSTDPRAKLLEQLRETQTEMGLVRDKISAQMEEFNVISEENEDVTDAINDINDGIDRMSKWL